MNSKFKIFLLWFLGIGAVLSFGNVTYVAYMSLKETGEFQFMWSSLFASMAQVLLFVWIKRGDFDNLFNKRLGRE